MTKQLLFSVLIAISVASTWGMKNETSLLLTAVKKQILVAKCSKKLEGHKGTVNSIAYHPHGTQLASGSADTTIKLWNTNTWECAMVLSEHTGSINVVIYHPTHRQLASGSDDKTIKLWDPETGQCIATLADHTGSIRSLSYHPHRMELVSRANDESIKMWDVKSNQCIYSFEDKGIYPCKYAAYHPDGEHIAITTEYGTNIKQWNLKKWQSRESDNPLKESNYDLYHQPNPRHEMSSMIYNQDGSQMAFGSYNVAKNAYVGIIQKNGESIKLQNLGRNVTAVAFHPYENKISASNYLDGIIRTWDTKNFTESPDFFFNIQETPYCLVYNLQGTHLAAGTLGGSIHIISTKLLSDTNKSLSDASNLITGLEKFITGKSQRLSAAEKEQLKNLGHKIDDAH